MAAQFEEDARLGQRVSRAQVAAAQSADTGGIEPVEAPQRVGAVAVGGKGHPRLLGVDARIIYLVVIVNYRLSDSDRRLGPLYSAPAAGSASAPGSR